MSIDFLVPSRIDNCYFLRYTLHNLILCNFIYIYWFVLSSLLLIGGEKPFWVVGGDDAILHKGGLCNNNLHLVVAVGSISLALQELQGGSLAGYDLMLNSITLQILTPLKEYMT